MVKIIFSKTDFFSKIFQSARNLHKVLPRTFKNNHKEIQGWILKFEEDSERLHTSVESFVEYIPNQSPPWPYYSAFMPGRLIALDKRPGVCPVGVGETWKLIFAKSVLRVTRPEVCLK